MLIVQRSAVGVGVGWGGGTGLRVCVWVGVGLGGGGILLYSRGKHVDRVATSIMYTVVFLWPISDFCCCCCCFICLVV